MAAQRPTSCYGKEQLRAPVHMPSFSNTSSFTPKRQPYYCEENAWHLCQEAILGPRPRHVVFVSNHERAVPMWNQRAGRGKPIVWDYHVIVLALNPVEIWDVDTTLGLPVSLADYVANSFDPALPECFQPLFRVVATHEFIATFASDRSHMQRKDGSFRKPPPAWPIIEKPGVKTNLMQFVDMSEPFVGDIMPLDELRVRFGAA